MERIHLSRLCNASFEMQKLGAFNNDAVNQVKMTTLAVDLESVNTVLMMAREKLLPGPRRSLQVRVQRTACHLGRKERHR